MEMFEHSYSSKFGTFLGNDEKDRVDNGFAKRTVSLWYVGPKVGLKVAPLVGSQVTKIDPMLISGPT